MGSQCKPIFELIEDPFHVITKFTIREKMSSLFYVEVEGRSRNDELDLGTVVGHAASFRLTAGIVHLQRDVRVWTGVCNHMELLHVESTGLSTYSFTLVPRLWLLTQRRNHRIFQYSSIPQIVTKVLEEWRVDHVWRVDAPLHPRLELRIQYGESDYNFITRLLEEAGISFFFEETDEGRSVLVLSDRPQSGAHRVGQRLSYVDNPNQSAEKEFVTEVRLTQDMRPGRYVIRDYDFRKTPEFPLFARAGAEPPEDMLEQYHYAPGAFAVVGPRSGDTPIADDKGGVRHEPKFGESLAQRGLEALRASRRVVSFQTNVLDIHPGVLFSISNHPRADLSEDKALLVTELTHEGGQADAKEWKQQGKAVFADVAYRPPKATSKPQINNVQSALVVGPRGEELHTDEYGRVRIQFHWDRDGNFDYNSSPWVRVSQGWAGAGFGMIAIPRIGQEVLVGFIEGDPDQPLVVGRLYNSRSRVPYKLPDDKTVSGWKSDSSPGGTGFNELRFDDRKGKELLVVRAERDLVKNVQRHERESTGKARTIRVGKTLKLTTGKASIILDGPNIIIQANEEIHVRSKTKDITLIGNPFVHINPEPPRPLVEEDIQVEGGVDEDVFVFGQKVYAENIVVHGSGDFYKKVKASLDKLRGTWAGVGLFNRVARARRSVTIVATDAQNGYVALKHPSDAVWMGKGTPGIGSDAKVFYNPMFAPAGSSSDVVLGTMMIQATNAAIGKVIPGETGGVPNGLLKAMGLAPYSIRSPTENSLRREYGLEPRLFF